jgi:hypothetical protein
MSSGFAHRHPLFLKRDHRVRGTLSVQIAGISLRMPSSTRFMMIRGLLGYITSHFSRVTAQPVPSKYSTLTS